MSNKSVLAFTAIAALGTSCLVPTDASALGFPARGATFSRPMVQAPPRPVIQPMRAPPMLTSHAPAQFSSTPGRGQIHTSSVDHTFTGKTVAPNSGNHIMSGGNGPVNGTTTTGGSTSGGNTPAGGNTPMGGKASGSPAPNGKTATGGNTPVGGNATGGNGSGGTPGGKTATGGNTPAGGNASGGTPPNSKTASAGNTPGGGNSMGGAAQPNGAKPLAGGPASGHPGCKICDTPPGGNVPGNTPGGGNTPPATSPADALAQKLRGQANAADAAAAKASADAKTADAQATQAQQAADALAAQAKVQKQIAAATGKPSDIVNAQIADAQAKAAQAAATQVTKAANQAESNATKTAMFASKADTTATQAEQVAQLANQGGGGTGGTGGTGGGTGGTVGGGGTGGGGVNVSVGGGPSDGGTQVAGLGGTVLVPQPVGMPDVAPAPVYGPGYYRPAYGTTGSAYGGASGRPAGRLMAIALGWNLDGAWVVRKNPSVDAATRDAVNQCNSQFGTCSLSDAVVTPAALGCLAIARSSDNANRLFAAARGSIDAARAAVMDQMTSAGSSGEVLYADCNG